MSLSDGWRLGTRLMAGAAMVCIAGCAGMTAPYESIYSDRENDIPVVALTPAIIEHLRKAPTLESAELPGAALDPSVPYSYRIQAADVLYISVPAIVTYNTPGATVMGGESGQNYSVYEDGTIFLPFGGSVKVAGLTLREAQETIVHKLGTFLKTPQVVVSVKEYRSQRVMVTGQVEKPGYQPITDVPLTLLGAVSFAGGISELRGRSDTRAVGFNRTSQNVVPAEFPDLARVTLRRRGMQYTIDLKKILGDGDISRDIRLENGDVVVVPPTQRANVFVLGEVVNPALVEIRKGDTDLAQVLMAGGSINQLSANPRRIYVIRGDFNGPTIYQLNSKHPDAFLLAQQFQMEPQDVVFVAQSPVGYWNQQLQQILPTVQGLLSTAVIVNTVDNLSNNN